MDRLIHSISTESVFTHPSVLIKMWWMLGLTCLDGKIHVLVRFLRCSSVILPKLKTPWCAASEHIQGSNMMNQTFYSKPEWTILSAKYGLCTMYVNLSERLFWHTQIRKMKKKKPLCNMWGTLIFSKCYITCDMWRKNIWISCQDSQMQLIRSTVTHWFTLNPSSRQSSSSKLTRK